MVRPMMMGSLADLPVRGPWQDSYNGRHLSDSLQVGWWKNEE